MSNKEDLVIIGIVILLAIITGIIFFVNKNNINETQEINNTTDSNQEESSTEDEEEEVEIEHNLKLSIISPEEEKIFPSQARTYNALAEGNGKYSSTVKCHWEFFLNENNEEVLYKVMDNTGVLEGESKEICGFTSSFMDRIGKLRVVLTMTVSNYLDEALETVTAERTYIVSK
jgi:hypothetical protein